MEFIINTDLSIEKTTILVDGENVSKSGKVASISFFADAPNKKYNEDGYVSVSVTSFDDEGNMKRQSFSKRPEMAENIKPIGLQDNVEFTENDVIRFLSDEVEVEKKTLVDSIITKCIEDKLACPNSDILLNRSIDSLRDKVEDLGISSEDS